jgi:hypothetical protein
MSQWPINSSWPSGSRSSAGACAVAGVRCCSPGRGSSRHALVNGAAGVLSWQGGRLIAVLGFTVAHGKIVAIDVLADPERLNRIENMTG